MIRDDGVGVARHRRFVGWGAPQLFMLLLTVTVLWSTVLSSRVVLAWHGGAAYRTCMDTAGFDPENRLHIAMLDTPARHGSFGHCYSETLSSALLIALLWSVGILLAAVVSCRRGPRWARRACFLDPPPELWPLLARLVSRAGIDRRAPDFVVDVAQTGSDAAALRRSGRTVVCLSAGLTRQARFQPGVVEAVILHELAHVRNSDVGIGYGARAVWRGFVLAVVVPFTATRLWWRSTGEITGPYAEFWPGHQQALPRDLLLVAFMVTVGYLIHARVQRTREHVADHDARAWGADPAVWQLLRPGSDDHRITLRGRAFTARTDVWRTHPRSAHRRRWLADSGMVDADHGRFGPNLLAVAAVMLTLTCLGRIAAADGFAFAVVSACAVLATLTLLSLGGVSKGGWHHWNFPPPSTV
ncbi:M48 family metalloprotease [Nocardia otitidiscaviarum]|uniref:M48 family metalloprotease n=1 Tax=Nocardia otitidiscaviarum TaxID=1823 RepID=UPI0018946826|nr:M48 family metalloprotease [Nocardia otitidiscaviarum]MBF6181731.1 M48 family metalloprotease [Nocardia otitidiscaviarum]